MKNVWILIMLTPITLLSIVGLVASYIYYQGTSERALEREQDRKMTRTAYTYYEKKLEREQEAEMIRDAELQIRMLEVAVEAYRIDTGAFPLTLDELVSDPGRIDKSSIVPKWRGPYCVRIPKDPWGQEYGYDRIERGNFIVINFDIYSKGKDGISGTADDINSWKMRKERDKERLEREIYFHPLGSE